MNAKKMLIVLAVLGLLTAAVTLLVPAARPPQLRGEALTGAETLPSVQASLERLLPAGAADASDPVLQAAVQQVRGEKYVAAAWLVDENGNIVVHEGGPGKAGEPVYKVGQDTLQMLAGLPEGAVDARANLMLVALGAMRAEGEHNDVFRHLVHPLNRADGSLGSLIVVAYDASPAVSEPGFAYRFFLLLGLGGLAAYWLALPAWVYLDARARGEASLLWALFVLVTNLVGVIAYQISVR